MKILFVADRSPQTFVLADRQILEAAHSVDWLSFRWSLENLRGLYARVRKSDLVFGWFASHHTFLPAMLAKTLKKKIIIAAADYDLANEPAFDYGSMRGGIRAWVNNRIFTSANLVLVPSDCSRRLALENTVLRHTPGKVRKLSLGFGPRKAGGARKREGMLTVGAVNREDWIRKGHREFVQVAARMSHVPAYLVGKVQDEKLAKFIRRSSSANLQVRGFLSAPQLASLFEKCQVYAQCSYLEGFGCSVAESMLAQCVPVVTSRGSLPEVVGECGYYAPYGNIDATCVAVVTAMSDTTMGARARERVLDLFSIDLRRRELLGLVEAVLDGGDGVYRSESRSDIQARI